MVLAYPSLIADSAICYEKSQIQSRRDAPFGASWSHLLWVL